MSVSYSSSLRFPVPVAGLVHSDGHLYSSCTHVLYHVKDGTCIWDAVFDRISTYKGIITYYTGSDKQKKFQLKIVNIF